jgi:N-dimethylarginine dimethylaminohydrolase
MRGADPARWHYGAGFDPARAAEQHRALVELLRAAGAAIEWLPDADDGLSDSVFTHDPSLVTERGAVILRMGKRLREPEPALHERAYERLGIPILGRIVEPGMVEGGDCVWLDARTLAVGRGVRTNQEGIEQLARLLAPLDVEVAAFDLPLWQGEEACLHLMSLISPLADDLALVHLPLMPVALYGMLKARGVEMIEAPPDEFAASLGLSLNVLATAPREAIAAAGFPRTEAALEAAGCTVSVFEAGALCIACEGGPTCLTRPILRLGGRDGAPVRWA